MTRAQHVIANLDCELSWLDLASKDPQLADLGVPEADRSLSAEAAQRIGPLATLLRALCDDDATLWMPFDVDPACMVEVEGLPLPRIERDMEGAPEGALEWGAVRDVEQARIAARCNHRRFAFDLGHIEESRWIASASDLDDGALPTRWVVKAPLSAAGRDRVIGQGPRSAGQRARVAGLIERQGPALLEPWVERSIDFACAGVVDGDETLRWHLNVVDDHGRFDGIGVATDGFTPPPPSHDVAVRVRDALREAGYRGPFGIDAYLSPVEGGAYVVNPLCEINARLTFGSVAHALVDRVRAHIDAEPPVIELWTGRGELPTSGTVLPLVRPTKHSDTTAWLQWESD